jgi:hypothetical protein
MRCYSTYNFRVCDFQPSWQSSRSSCQPSFEPLGYALFAFGQCFPNPYSDQRSAKSRKKQIGRQMGHLVSRVFGRENAGNTAFPCPSRRFHGYLASGSSFRATPTGSVAELRNYGRFNAGPWHWRQYSHLQLGEFVAAETAARDEPWTDRDPDTARE